MLMVGFFQWWYGAGWRKTATLFRGQLLDIYEQFSVPTLLSTLFEPWRRIITAPGAGLDAHMRAMVDNLVSRAVGSTMRLFTLIAAGLVLASYSAGGGLLLLLWPLIPLLGPALVVWGMVP
jgi:hypothetical protein